MALLQDDACAARRETVNCGKSGLESPSPIA